MLAAYELTIKYRDTTVLSDINFSVDGEILGILAANGAGKTTLIETLCQICPAAFGSMVAGEVSHLDTEQYKSKIGYVPKVLPLLGHLNVIEQLAYCAKLRHIKKNDDEIVRVIGITGLRPLEHAMTFRLTNYEKRLLGIAVALLGDPEVLLLDEPFSALTYPQIVNIANLLKSFTDKTIVFTSSTPANILLLANKILVIYNREVVFFDKISQIDSAISTKRVSLLLSNQSGEVQKNITNLAGVLDVSISDVTGELFIQIMPGYETALISRFCMENGLIISELKQLTVTRDSVLATLMREGRV